MALLNARTPSLLTTIVVPQMSVSRWSSGGELVSRESFSWYAVCDMCVCAPRAGPMRRGLLVCRRSYPFSRSCQW